MVLEQWNDGMLSAQPDGRSGGEEWYNGLLELEMRIE